MFSFPTGNCNFPYTSTAYEILLQHLHFYSQNWMGKKIKYIRFQTAIRANLWLLPNKTVTEQRKGDSQEGGSEYILSNIRIDQLFSYNLFAQGLHLQKVWKLSGYFFFFFCRKLLITESNSMVKSLQMTVEWER